uniref:Uncharacterized protein n=1 Tax=Anguilla anguilla TaxID=7936 RepID=A0A0E9WW91_ANGAN
MNGVAVGGGRLLGLSVRYFLLLHVLVSLPVVKQLCML